MVSLESKKISKKLSILGDRPQDISLRLANIIFFILTMFFGFVYFMVVSTQEVVSSPGFLEDDITTYLIVIVTLSMILLIMEFYSSLTGKLRILRLVCIVTLVFLVGFSIKPVIENAENAGGDPGEITAYVFSALTLGTAGTACILNFLEIFKNY